MAKTYDEIIESIFLGLNGDSPHDIEYLQEQAEKYKDHELSKEITRAIGRKLYEVLPEEERAEVEAIFDNHGNSSENVIHETILAMQQGEPGKALGIIEPFATKLKELNESGLCLEDSVSAYYNFNSLIDHILTVELTGQKKEVRLATEPFAEVYALYAGVLYELDRHEDAINWLEEALRWNPAATRFYFEIADNYKKLNEFAEAEKWDDKAYPFIANPSALARWYRDKGFVAIEDGQYELAAALFVISCIFEESPQAMSELMFMKKHLNADYTGMDVKEAAKVLERADVPIGPNPTTVGLLVGIEGLAEKQGDPNYAADISYNIYCLTFDEEWLTKAQALSGQQD